MVALAGPLGAGKTAFVRGLVAGLGGDPGLVASPTFTIAHEYPLPGGRRLAHLDLYRVGSLVELDATGWLDWLGPGTWLAVEWSDRFPEALPSDRLEVTLARVPAADAGTPRSERLLEAGASGPRAGRALAAWRRAVATGSGSHGAREWP